MRDTIQDGVDRRGTGVPAADRGPAPPGETSPAPDTATPEAFLAAAGAWPRGFWQRGRRWHAFAGRALELTAAGAAEGDGRPTEGAGRPTDGDGGADGRFERIRRAARRLPDEAPGGGPVPRLYGGFSFYGPLRRGARRSPSWEALGDARFVLPAADLEGGEPGSGPGRLVTRRAGVGTAEGRPDPDSILRALDRDGFPPAEAGDLRPRAARATVSEEAWRAAVERALRAIDAGRLTKVVLARTLEVELGGHPDPLALLRRLRRENPGSYAFFFEPRPGVAFFSAAPELVGALDGREFHATAVAGTIRRGADAAEDEELAWRLLDSAKDRAEHGLGVRDMTERLATVAPSTRVDGEPRVARQNAVQHLRTDLRATLAGPAHILSLVGTLHPTAAVCGYPREAARTFLLEEEPFERGWYASPVGWFDAAGNGEFAPGLRSGLVRGDRAWLFAGAGIVEGSRADREWEETRLKFGPALQVLGLPPGP